MLLSSVILLAGGGGGEPEGDKVPVVFQGTPGVAVLVSVAAEDEQGNPLDVITVNGRQYAYFQAEGTIAEDGSLILQLFPGFNYLPNIGGALDRAFHVPATGMPSGGWRTSELPDAE